MKNIISRNSIFAWLALATGILLLIPFVAMQLSSQVQWSFGDFGAMGALLFGTCSLYVLIARRIKPQQRIFAGVVLGLAFFYIWSELAVGVFLNLAD
ncbi:hypothetical protein [Microbulbifer sp. TYP-18]|uniref:hypothetical protein n=1 Tax=Microbulbifer sp. TYP-18 TaxID=3230024 RepID=UPI0034C655C4